MASDTDGGTGYRKPPRRSQFKKGQSGNPKGRPKKTSTFQADLNDELHEKLLVTENGRTKKITKQRLFIKTLTTAAIKKDIKAVNALLACIRLFGVGETQETPEPTDIDDLDFLEAYLAQRRKHEVRSATAVTKKKGSGRTGSKA
jgi:hypothetical protein